MLLRRVALSLALLLVWASADTPATLDATAQEMPADPADPPAEMKEEEPEAPAMQNSESETLIEESEESKTEEEVPGGAEVDEGADEGAEAEEAKIEKEEQDDDVEALEEESEEDVPEGAEADEGAEEGAAAEEAKVEKEEQHDDVEALEEESEDESEEEVPEGAEADGHNLTLLPLETGFAKVWLVKDFISQEEASELLTMGSRADFGTSLTKHSDGQEWRSSSSTVLKRDNAVVDRVRRRAAMVCGVRPSFVEDLQIVRYQPGERYQPHMDSDGPHHRHWTLLLYLNDPGSGGATGFPMLQLRVMPAPRAAVLWENLRSEPGMDLPVRNYYTLHDGQAPTGEHPKFAVNIWVRNSEYVPGMA